MSTNTTGKQRKPRPRPARSIRVLEQAGPDTDGWAAVAITVGKQTDTYLLRTIPTDFGNGAIGFEVEKLEADLATVETYHVLLNGPESSCDCKGHDRWGHCKHRDGIQAAVQTGRLRFRSVADLAANYPDTHREHEAAIAGVFTPDPKDCLGPEYEQWLDSLDQPDPAA
jgi:hypothetical protein